MWVKRKEYEELKRRIDELARRVSDSEYITVYQSQPKEVFDVMRMSIYNHFPKKEISVQEVIGKILEKLGMELVYVEGQPTRVEMQKKK